MELQDLRTFDLVAALNSMSRAADALDTSQPTVSKRVLRLESTLGVPLIDRSVRPFALTAQGERFHRVVQAFLTGLEDVAGAQKQDTSVSIATTPFFVAHRLIPVIGAFRQQYPALHLSVLSGTSDAVVQMLRDGRADVALLTTRAEGQAPTLQDLVLEPCFRSERALITPKGHPLAQGPLEHLGQIAAYPLISRGPETPTRQAFESELRRMGGDPKVVLELDSMDTVKRCVGLGLGVSVALLSTIEPADYDVLEVIPLGRFLPPLYMSIATLRGRPIAAAVECFLQVLRTDLQG